MSDGDLLMKIITLVSLIGNAAAAWAIITGRTQSQKREISGELSGKKEWVETNYFYKHAELNRADHARIEAEFGQEVRRLEDKVDDSTREILAAGEKRAHDLHERLNVMQSGTAHTQGQLAQLIERVTEAARTANEAAKTSQAAMVEAQHKRA